VGPEPPARDAHIVGYYAPASRTRAGVSLGYRVGAERRPRSGIGSCSMCEQGQAAAGERLGGVLVGAGCYVDDLPGAGGQEHGQDGADIPADSRGGSVGGVVRGLPVVGLGERARGDRERERRDAASRVGLGCGVPVRIASGSVLLREVSVTTCGGGRIFLSGGPDPVGPGRSHVPELRLYGVLRSSYPRSCVGPI
jgi:hypothetical protein